MYLMNSIDFYKVKVLGLEINTSGFGSNANNDLYVLRAAVGIIPVASGKYTTQSKVETTNNCFHLLD